jgi:hypothetical protein
MTTIVKRTPLNFTLASWTKKRPDIKGGKVKYFLPNPNAARLSKLSAGDAVVFTGRQIGLQGTAIVENVERDSSGIHIRLQNVKLL